MCDLVTTADAGSECCCTDSEEKNEEDEFEEIYQTPLDHDLLDSQCSNESHIRESILFEAAVSASNEADFISELGSKCRVELFELLLKADLDKEKIKEKVRSLQEFLVAAEHRSDELIARVERLLKN
jgi:hypothetical protein